MTTDTPVRARARRLLVGACALVLAGSGVAAGQEPSASVPVEPSPTTFRTPTLEERLAAAEEEVRQLTAERDRLQAAFEGFDDLYAPMEADRQLLVELRKTLPETRPDAESYLARMQRLALQSDPARLSLVANRVMETAPVFLDWRHTEFATPAEANQAFLESGAAGFNTDFEELRNAILLTVANRLDALLTTRDRIR